MFVLVVGRWESGGERQCNVNLDRNARKHENMKVLFIISTEQRFNKAEQNFGPPQQICGTGDVLGIKPDGTITAAREETSIYSVNR